MTDEERARKIVERHQLDWGGIGGDLALVDRLAAEFARAEKRGYERGRQEQHRATRAECAKKCSEVAWEGGTPQDCHVKCMAIITAPPPEPADE